MRLNIAIYVTVSKARILIHWQVYVLAFYIILQGMDVSSYHGDPCDVTTLNRLLLCLVHEQDTNANFNFTQKAV